MKLKTTAYKNVKRSIKKHGPAILTGFGIAGMIATTFLAVQATPKAIILIEDKKEIKAELEEECTPIDIVKVAWKPYIPAMITGVLSIGCLIGAHSAHTRRYATLAAAYTLSESSLRDYRDKVIETIGEKKEKEVQDALAKEKVEKNPVSNCEVIITERGNTLCFDTISGRYFKSDIDKIKKAVNEINRELLDEMFITLNELYYELGLGRIAIGDDLGWDIANGLIEVYFSSQLDEYENPCLVLNYPTPPQYREFG